MKREPSRFSFFIEPRTRRARRLTVAAMFSLDVAAPASNAAFKDACARAARALHDALGPGAVALLTGPSGCGKSSVLRTLAALLGRRRASVIAAPSPAALLAERRTPVDLLHASLDDDLRLLCACGLAEAPLWIRPARLLSDGERARLALALAVDRARDAARPVGRAAIIADEFASTLDRIAARTLCLGVRRALAGRADLRLVLATAHHDVVRWLEPDVTLTLHAGFAHHGRFELTLRSSGRAA